MSQQLLLQQQQQQQIWPRAATPRSANQGLEEERLIGRIKRYVDMPGGGGYGFIDCEDTKLRFSRDVYIHKNQMHGLTIGDSVSFTIVRNNKGEPQARNVMRSEDALMLRPGAQQQAGDSWRPPVTLAQQAAWPQGSIVGLPSDTGCGSNYGCCGSCGGCSVGGGTLVQAPALRPPAVSSMLAAAAAPTSMPQVPLGAYPMGANLMDEEQARQFQAALRGTGW